MSSNDAIQLYLVLSSYDARTTVLSIAISSFTFLGIWVLPNMCSGRDSNPRTYSKECVTMHARPALVGDHIFYKLLVSLSL